MSTGVVAWSKTASSNATADANVNWAEGMAPSAVNNSARAEMASVAMYRDDQAGSLVTGGTSTAYTVTTNQGFASLTAMNGQSIRVQFNAANGASPTLNVDSLGAKAIQTATGTAVGTGAILADTIYDLVYDNTNGVWLLVAPPANVLMAPSGTIMLFRQTSAPAGWTKDTTNYNDHAIRIVTGTPSSGGSTAFSSVFASRTIAQNNLPDVTLTTSGTGTATVTAQSALGVPSTASPVALGGTGSSTYNYSSFGAISITTSGTTSSLNGGVTQQGIDFAVKYADCIFATKD